jgi:hypothetical protein
MMVATMFYLKIVKVMIRTLEQLCVTSAFLCPLKAGALVWDGKLQLLVLALGLVYAAWWPAPPGAWNVVLVKWVVRVIGIWFVVVISPKRCGGESFNLPCRLPYVVWAAVLVDVFQWLRNLLVWLMNVAAAVLVGLFQRLNNGFLRLRNLLVGMFVWLMNVAAAVLVGLFQRLNNGFLRLRNLLVGMFVWLMNVAAAVLGGVFQRLNNGFRWLRNLLVGMFVWLMNVAAAVLGGVFQRLNNGFRWLRNLVG